MVSVSGLVVASGVAPAPLVAPVYWDPIRMFHGTVMWAAGEAVPGFVP